jgi:phage-related protein
VAALRSRAAGLASHIRNALGTPGDILFNAGRSILQGLIDGIRSRLGDLGGFLSGVGQFIKDHKGPIEKDRKLLLPEGRAIMAGLVQGVTDGMPSLGARLGDVTDMFTVGVDPTASLSFTGAMAAPAPAPLLVGIDPASSSDWLMDGIRRNVTFRFNGDPIKAFSAR